MKLKTMTAAVDRTSRPAIYSTALPLLVLVIGIPASFFLFTLIQDSVENIARLRFEREAKDANSIIESRLRSYNDVLYALRAVFASEEDRHPVVDYRPAQHWRIFPGQVDPADPTHLTIPCEIDGKPAIIDGRLNDGDRLMLTPRAGRLTGGWRRRKERPWNSQSTED